MPTEYLEERLMKPYITNWSKNPRLKKLAWFVGLYCVGVLSVGAFVFLLRFILGLPV